MYIMRRFRCRAVLFDLDGVLVDSTSYIEEQWRNYARSKGLAAGEGAGLLELIVSGATL